MRKLRKVIAINEVTGEREEFPSVYSCAQRFEVKHPNILQCLANNWCVGDWRIYDCAEAIRERIADLERQLKEVEGK